VILHLLDCVPDELAEPFLADRPIVAFDIGVLLWLAGLDIEQANAALLRPGLQFPADVFRTVLSV
jgi:hypothetical protein